MKQAMDKIYVTLDLLWENSRTKLMELPLEVAGPVAYKSDNQPPKEGWRPFAKEDTVQGKDTHFWFRTTFSTPESPCFVQCTTGYEGKWDATNPQGLIYLNGTAAQGCDTNHTEIFLEPATEYTLHNYFYVGMIDTAVPLGMTLYALDEETEQLYYDMKVAKDACELYKEDSEAFAAVMDILNRTANEIDFRDPTSAAYRQSVQRARELINKELYTDLCSTEGKPKVCCVGHTHIDVEWRWARAQTREKIQRSFATADSLMDRYPEFVFMLSQPELYRYLKEENAELYQRLKDRVAQKRWEPEGAMWVESDCNLISGESFVRQILQGKQFFKKEFGVDCNILFLPDVFGYSAAMPQILKKSGIDYFMTSKISWNDTNTMPYDSFLWQGIDGTEIFATFITTQKYTETPARKTTYNGNSTVSQIKGTRHRFSQKAYGDTSFMPFGHGDGGGGPTKEMLEIQRRTAKGLPELPVTKACFLREYLDEAYRQFCAACERRGHSPKWVGELYLEYHRGTYTSIAKNKRHNRKSEFMLQKSEALSYLDLLRGGSYDAEGLYAAWNSVLHNQFHDIIPGSSIAEVYQGTDTDYAQIEAFCRRLIKEKLTALSESVQATKGFLVYNALGFAVQGPMQLQGKTVELRRPIPALGYAVIEDAIETTSVSLSALQAENQYYRLVLDTAGRICELYDKEAGRQIFKEGCKGNEIQIFEDRPRKYDAWEISSFYKDKCLCLDDAAEITPIEDGARAGFRVTRHYGNSTIIQNIWLYSENRRIDFETELDWRESHQLVKAAFPLDLHTDKATYEIQYGAVERPTHQNTSWDAAKFEVCGHKWVDLSEDDYGVSLLNDCKYGYSCEGSTLKITWLKCATDPSPTADQGMHRFTYSLLPHSGSYRTAGVLQESYLLNQPLTAVAVSDTAGSAPDVFSLIGCDKENIIIDTVKKAEEDNSMILRLYEAYDRRTTVTLTLPDGVVGAELCDLMEQPLQPLEMVGQTVTLSVKNREIVTVKCYF